MTDIEHRQGCPATGGYGHGIEPCICGAVANVELLPLPTPNGDYTNPYDGDDLENYARACVVRATAAKDNKIEGLKRLVRHLAGNPNFDFEAALAGWQQEDGTLE